MLELNAKTRDILGKKVKSLRAQGVLPGVVYGAKVKSAPIKLDYNEFKKVFDKAGESTIIKLKIKDKEKKEKSLNILIHGVEKHPVSEQLTHVDFYAVRMDKTITTEIPLAFEGESPAVENLDGTLVRNINQVEIEALPADLPHEIKVDISSLRTFDDDIYIKDLKVGENVKILVDSGEVVASVTPPRTEEELAALEEEIEEKTEEIEKVGQEDEEEEEEEEISPAEKSEDKKQEAPDKSSEAESSKAEKSSKE